MVLDAIRSMKPYALPFFTLQYPTDAPLNPDSFPNSTYYNVGVRDIWLIVTCIAIMAILRDALRLGVFEPFARWKLSRDLRRKRQRIASKKTLATANGNGHVTAGNGHANGHADKDAAISPKELRQMNRSVLRFAEQGWSVVYYTLQWTYGLYVHYSLPTRIFNPVDLWLGYPHIPLAGPLKFYYLTQTAFYMHQMLILNAEARRKDHVQMMTHHVITVFLMGASYFMNFTRVGCVIMFLMDWCDIFLPLAKMLRYINHQTACDVTFGCFILTWFVTRHFLFLFVIKSTIFDVPKLLPFEPSFIPEEGYYLTKSAHTIFYSLLLFLQVLQVIWFWMICRIAWRVIKGNPASDDRSDEEDIKED